ncbi:MAG: hypothetical protein WCK47_03700 [bacterium]
MELEGISDFSRIVARCEECLHMRNHDRPLLHLWSPAPGAPPTLPPSPADIRERWFNFDWRLDCHKAFLMATEYHAEGFPSFFCNLGPDVIAAFLGAELSFAQDTSWAHPFVHDWEALPSLRFDAENPFWKAMENFLRLATEHGRGKWITQTGDLHSGADALSALRGPEELCMDIIENPAEIAKRLDECHEVWLEVVQRHCKIILPATEGLTTSWIPLAVHGRYAVLQNDFSCLVSGNVFDSMFAGVLRREAQALDWAVYHWDGPDAIRHMDSICALPEIRAIQWVPGAGQPPMAQWIDLLHKVQARGKGLTLFCEAGEVIPLTEELRPEGLMLFAGANDGDEARTLIKEVERICRRKRNPSVAMP